MNIFQAKKYETKIKSIITVSNIHSISEISRISNIDEADIVTVVEKMIRKGNNNNIDYRAFKNAHIDFQSNHLVLDESKENGIMNKVGKLTGSLIDKFTPKEVVVKEDWKCSYCGGTNESSLYECSKCGAKK